jgi:hypothetical protein
MWCVLAQITINKIKCVLAQSQEKKISIKGQEQKFGVLAQITINKEKSVLAQITRNNIFL